MKIFISVITFALCLVTSLLPTATSAQAYGLSYDVELQVSPPPGLTPEEAVSRLGLTGIADPNIRKHASEGFKDRIRVHVLWDDDCCLQMPNFIPNWSTGSYAVVQQYRDGQYAWSMPLVNAESLSVGDEIQFQSTISQPKQQILAGDGTLEERWKLLIEKLKATPGSDTFLDADFDVDEDGFVTMSLGQNLIQRWSHPTQDRVVFEYSYQGAIDKSETWIEAEEKVTGARYMIEAIPFGILVVDSREIGRQVSYEWEGTLKDPDDLRALRPNQGNRTSLLPLAIAVGLILSTGLGLLYLWKKRSKTV